MNAGDYYLDTKKEICFLVKSLTNLNAGCGHVDLIVFDLKKQIQFSFYLELSTLNRLITTKELTLVDEKDFVKMLLVGDRHD